jgi:(p)ppGpp synthase/HD superfamily hydrolase
MLTNLSALISFAVDAHRDSATKPSKAVRKWDGKTPYGIHPTWCAMTLLTETTISEELRITGAQALLLHDVLEDTTAVLPEGTPAAVRKLVEEMTFEGSDEEMEHIWSRSLECKLLKLYDKVSNLLDAAWMTAEKRSRYAAYLAKLCDAVEPTYGRLNIIRIARAIT